VAAEAGYQGLDLPQADAGSLGLGADEGFKEPVRKKGRGDAGTIVPALYLKSMGLLDHLCGDLDPGLSFLGAAGLCCIQDQILQDNAQEFGIGMDGLIRRTGEVDRDVGEPSADPGANGPQELAEIHL